MPWRGLSLRRPLLESPDDARHLGDEIERRGGTLLSGVGRELHDVLRVVA
jgi:hypothetical protein